MPATEIIISTQNFPPAAGGIQNYMYELALALHELGNRVTVFCDAPKMPQQEEFDANQPFDIVRVGGPKVIRRLSKARRVMLQLRQASPALLICDSWKSLEHLQPAKLKQVRSLCIGHGMEFPQLTNGKKQGKKQQRIQGVLARAQAVLANSHFTAGRIKPYAPDPSRIHILHPGVRRPLPPSPQDVAKIAQWVDGHQPIITTVGRLEARKGQDKVIELIPRLVQQYPTLRYLIAGSGPLEDTLKQRVDQLGIAEQVRFCGRISDSERAALLQRADIFAMPCRAVGDSVEGFGIVYIEAAMFGVPSLAGRLGGAGDAVLDGQTGLLCDGDNDDDIFDKITALIAAPARTAAMGQQARQRAESELQWQTIASKLLAISETV